MTAFSIDLRQGIRRLSRSPGFTLATVLTLGLGIGANTAAFSLLRHLVIGIVPFQNADRLVMIHEEMPQKGRYRADLSAPNYLDFKQHSTSYESMAVWTNKRMNMSSGGEPVSLQVSRVSWTLFPTLGLEPELGRFFSPEEDWFDGPKVAVLSNSLWRGRFGGDPNLVGEMIRLDGTPYQVVGVVESGGGLPFTLPANEADLFVPMAFTPNQLNRRGAHGIWGVGLLKPGITAEVADQEIKVIAAELARLYPDDNGQRTAAVYPLSREASRMTRDPVVALMAVAGFVLLIVCANVAGLLLAKGLQRRRELAVRSALGARTSTLVRLILTEDLVLGFLGCLCGLLVAQSMMVGLPHLFPFLRRVGEIELDGSLLLFTVLVSLVATVLFGALPAWQTSRSNTTGVLKDGARDTGRKSHHRLRRGLVVFELAVATALVAGTGLLLRSLDNLQEVNPGFDPEGLLTASCVRPEAKYPGFEGRRVFFDNLASRIAAIPGVKTAALTNTLPLGSFRMNNAYFVDGQPQPPGHWFLAFDRSVTPGFFQTMGVPILQGRDFSADDVDRDVIIVNKHLANEHWPGESPLGKRIAVRNSSEMRTIIGVAGNILQDNLFQGDYPETYKPLAQENLFQYVSFVLRVDGDPHLVIPALKSAVEEVDADIAIYDCRTGNELIERQVNFVSTGSTLAAGFSFLALILAAIGLNALISILVEVRTREIGIRMAFGAQKRDILSMVLCEGMKLSAFGITIGLALAFGLGRVIGSLLFNVSSTDLMTFLVVPIVLAAVALVSCFLPARRAAGLYPAAALRHQ